MCLHCKTTMDGPGPSEAIVAINKADGSEEEVIVHQSLINGNFLEVGPILQQKNGSALIELPRESVSGNWRVWVKFSDLTEQNGSMES